MFSILANTFRESCWFVEWARYVACRGRGGGNKNVYKMTIHKPLGKRPL